MKRYLLLLPAFLLTSCMLTKDFPEDFVPDTATDVQVYSVDYKGDGVKHDAVYYKSIDEIAHQFNDKNIWVYQEHVDIYESEEGPAYVIGLTYPNEEYYYYEKGGGKPSTIEINKIKDIEIVDIGSDGKEELLIRSENPRHYKVIGFQDGEIREMEIPRGFDNKTPGMRFFVDMPEFYGSLGYITFEDGKIIEHWRGQCEGGRHWCYTFEFHISYDSEKDEWAISKALNAKKSEPFYQEWIDQYNDGVDEWDGELLWGTPPNTD